MNIYIAYASNSGNTMLVAERIAERLGARKHKVIQKNVAQADIPELAKADCVLLGSPSWMTDGQEGQPTQQFNAFAEQLRRGPRYSAKPFAVFGCGRHEYTRFTGAVDALERLAEEVGGILAIPSLRVDGFPHHQDSNIVAWADDLSDWLDESARPTASSAVHQIPVKRIR